MEVNRNKGGALRREALIDGKRTVIPRIFWRCGTLFCLSRCGALFILCEYNVLWYLISQ